MERGQHLPNELKQRSVPNGSFSMAAVDMAVWLSTVLSIEGSKIGNNYIYKFGNSKHYQWIDYVTNNISPYATQLYMSSS